MTLHEVYAAADAIHEVIDPNANILYSTVIDETMEGKIQVSITATGFADRIQ